MLSGGSLVWVVRFITPSLAVCAAALEPEASDYLSPDKRSLDSQPHGADTGHSSINPANVITQGDSQLRYIAHEHVSGDRMKISGNTVFIPGATSGIGLALADQLQAKGNTVIVGGRRTELLDRIAADHPGLDTVQIDTTDQNSVQASARLILDKHPDLNVLVTMAGIMKIEDWHKPESFVAEAESTIAT